MGSFSIWHWLIVLFVLFVPAALVIGLVVFLNGRRDKVTK